jgi:hypothetical protein
VVVLRSTFPGVGRYLRIGILKRVVSQDSVPDPAVPKGIPKMHDRPAEKVILPALVCASFQRNVSPKCAGKGAKTVTENTHRCSTVPK